MTLTAKKKIPTNRFGNEPSEMISIFGAREHNLQNLDLKIPRNKLTVVTGLSGSGKSSLAFDTIYAEGQRRYLESLSSYARQFLEKLKSPDVDYIGGLSPSVAIDQKAGARNPRSTVSTVTEVYDYLRLLYSKAGTIKEGEDAPMETFSVDDLTAEVFNSYADQNLRILASIAKGKKGEYQKVFQGLLKQGFDYLQIDGEDITIDASMKLKKSMRHDISVIVDELAICERNRSRVREALKTAGELSEGAVALVGENINRHFFIQELGDHRVLLKQYTPNMFSFNSPYGACETCRGLGRISRVSEKGIIQNPDKSLLGGALNEDIFFSFNKYFIEDLLYDLAKHYHFEWKLPYSDWPKAAQEAFLYGDDKNSGLSYELERLFHETQSEKVRTKIRKFLSEDVCPACQGNRLKKEILAIKIGGKNIAETTALSIEDAGVFFEELKIQNVPTSVSEPILKEIRMRLGFLSDVGLGYLNLNRAVNTLSGGELQRIRLGAQLGMGLSGVLYVLDEPSIGLHPRDHHKLLNAFESLRDQGNTVLVVEHDEDTIRRADYLIDLGPGAGIEGGRVMAAGSWKELEGKSSPTLDYLSGRKKISLPLSRFKIQKNAKKIKIEGCTEHNLKNVTAHFPIGSFICVTGVSGSGKSTLIHDTLYKELHNRLWKTHYKVGAFKKISGMEHIDKVVEIDQNPIGRTPRSIPATYTDVFGPIRNVFSSLELSKMRNYTASRFSFNLKGGRCEHCRGEGVEKLEMSFMSDVYVECEYCEGRRYEEATLEALYRGKSIADVLDLSISEAVGFFSAFSLIHHKLSLLEKLGLGYIKLGQPSTTLSGGEAQRIKIATELSKKSTGKTLYILDEPTTGLHFEDVSKLISALFELRDQGNTVLVVEHNMDVIKMADHIIDLGPEGGTTGGNLVVEGPPEIVAKNKNSYTGKILQSYLSLRPETKD